MRRLRISHVAANVAHGLVDVSIGHGEVEPAIQVDVQKSAAKTQAVPGGDAHPGLRRDVFETLAARPIEANHFVIEVRDRNARRAGIIEVRHVDSHARAGFSFAAECQSGLHCGVLECAVVLIAIQLVRLGVIGHEQIRPAIVVVIEQRDSQRFGTAVEDSARRSDIFERAVATIMKEPARRPAIRFGRAVGFVLTVEAAEYVVLRRPLHIVADKKIEQPIAIVIEPQCGRAEPFALAKPAVVGHIEKRAFPGVAEQAILSHASDQNVWEAVVVVISNCYSHAIHFEVEPGA